MKKVLNKETPGKGEELRSEYDFSNGVRGKHHQAMKAGYATKIHKANGTTVTKETKPLAPLISFAPCKPESRDSQLAHQQRAGDGLRAQRRRPAAFWPLWT
jgi:hypothetical protein